MKTKQLIVSTEDTDVVALAEILNQEQISSLIYWLKEKGKICIPQFYTSDSHAQHYGFDNLYEMQETLNDYEYYNSIDEDMFDLAQND